MATQFPARVYIERAALAFGLPANEITGPRRPNRHVRARWSIMLAMKDGASSCQIGRRLNRDHSSVLHGLRNAQWYLENDEDFAARCQFVATGRQS